MSDDGTPLATDVIVDLLARGHAVKFPARGDSMHPLIRCDEVLHVEPNREVRVGDVVLTLADRGLTAHRVMSRDGTTIVTRGDNAPTEDPPIELSRVLGRVRIPGLRRFTAAVHRVARSIYLAAHAHLRGVPRRVDRDP